LSQAIAIGVIGPAEGGGGRLYSHVIAGKGNMPPRGGTTWPDATIHMAADYIVSLAK
jgi:cytochrome c5